MNLDTIKTAATSAFSMQMLQMKKSSPTLLFGAGVVGVIATAVLASKATLQLEEVLEDTKDLREKSNNLIGSNHPAYSQEDHKKDNLFITTRAAGQVLKLYAPAIGVGIVSVAALTGSHVILTNRNAALMAAYSALDKGFNEYRARVRDEYGEDKDREFRHGYDIRERVVEDEDGNETIEKTTVVPEDLVPSIYARFFDQLNANWSKTAEYNYLFLRCHQNFANDRLNAHGHLFLNEVYDMLGVPRSKAGAMVGWVISKDGDNFVDFGIFDGTNERKRMFVNGDEHSILLDFNVDGVIYHLMEG